MNELPENGDAAMKMLATLPVSEMLDDRWKEYHAAAAKLRHTLIVEIYGDCELLQNDSQSERRPHELFNRLHFPELTLPIVEYLCLFGNLTKLTLDLSTKYDQEEDVQKFLLDYLRNVAASSVTDFKIKAPKGNIGSLKFVRQILDVINTMTNLKKLHISTYSPAYRIFGGEDEPFRLSAILPRLEEFRFSNDFAFTNLIPSLNDAAANENCQLNLVAIEVDFGFFSTVEERVFTLPPRIISVFTHLEIGIREVTKQELKQIAARLPALRTLSIMLPRLPEHENGLLFDDDEATSLTQMTQILEPLQHLENLKLVLTGPLPFFLPPRQNKRMRRLDHQKLPPFILPKFTALPSVSAFELIYRDETESHKRLPKIEWSAAFPNLTKVTLRLESGRCKHCNVAYPAGRKTSKTFKPVFRAFDRCSKVVIEPFKKCLQLKEVEVIHEEAIYERSFRGLVRTNKKKSFPRIHSLRD